MKLAIFLKKLDYITFEAQMSYYAEYDIQIIYNFLCDQTCHIKGGELSLLNCAWLPPWKRGSSIKNMATNNTTNKAQQSYLFNMTCLGHMIIVALSSVTYSII